MIEGFALVGFGYVAVGFVLGAKARFFTCCQVAAEVVAPVVEEVRSESGAILEEVRELCQPVFDRAAEVVDVAIEVVAEQKILTRDELRKACQAVSVKWRNAHGKHKHLTVAEMRSALGLG
jgi:hypothetical protein